MTALNPRESGKYIIQNADHITVNNEGIDDLSKAIFKEIKSGDLCSENFSQNNPDLHPTKSDPRAVEWIFILDTLNFCFWTPGEFKFNTNSFTFVMDRFR